MIITGNNAVLTLNPDVNASVASMILKQASHFAGFPQSTCPHQSKTPVDHSIV